MEDDSVEPRMIGHKQEVLRGGVFMSLSPIVSLVLGLAVTWLIQLYITQAQYGVFWWYNTLGSFFITLAPFQLPGAVNRYIAVSKGEKNPDAIEQLVKTSSLLALILVPVSGLAAFTITPFVFRAFNIGDQYSLIDGIIFMLGMMSVNLSSFTQGISSGYHRFKELGLSQLASNVLSQGLVIVLIPLGWGIRALLLKFVVSGISLALLLTFLVKGIWSLKGELFPLGPLIRFSYPSIISFLFAFILDEVVVLAIFQSYSGSEVGLYAFAARLLTFLDALTLGYYNTLGPYYSQAVGQGKDHLNSELQWTMRMSFFLFMPLITVSMMISPSAFLVVFPKFYWAYQYFLILSFRLFFYLFARPYSMALAANAKTKHVLVSSVISSTLSGALMIILYDYGLAVVLAAYASQALFQALITGGLVKRYVGVELGLRKAFPVAMIAFSSLAIAVPIHFLRLNPFIELAAVVSAFLLVYIGLIRLFHLVSGEEIEKASLFLPRRISIPASRLLIQIFVRRYERRIGSDETSAA